MAELETAITVKDEELRTAKEAASTSSRTEALTDLRTSVQALDEVERRGKPTEVEAIRARIKGRVPFLVESIWVRMERQSARSTWIHVRLYLHGGEERPFVVAVGKPPQGAARWATRTSGAAKNAGTQPADKSRQSR